VIITSTHGVAPFCRCLVQINSHLQEPVDGGKQSWVQSAAKPTLVQILKSGEKFAPFVAMLIVQVLQGLKPKLGRSIPQLHLLHKFKQGSSRYDYIVKKVLWPLRRGKYKYTLM
jgi:hypothetical protein